MSVNPEGNWRAFRHRNYRILFTANALSNIGTWAQRIAQDWLVLQLTDNSGTALGLVTALQFAPVLFFSLHGGAMADRVDKRTALIWTNVGGFVFALLLGVLALTNNAQMWHVYFCALGLGVMSAVDAPIRQSFVSEVVGKKDIGNAVSLNSANFNAGRLIGPALSGFLIARFDTGPSIIYNAFSYLFVVGALSLLRESEFHIGERKESNGAIREGINYVKARPDLYVIMLAVFFIATFGLNFQIFNSLMARTVFGKGAASFGLLGTFIAIGSLSGALLSTRLEKRRSTLFVLRMGGVFSASIILLSFAPSYEVYAVLLPLCGLTALTTLITANALIQTKSDPAVRGRVTGLYLLVFMGGTPFGSPFIGWLAEQIGMRPTIAICGGISLMAVITIWTIYRDRVEVPEDIAVESVLYRAYDNER